MKLLIAFALMFATFHSIKLMAQEEGSYESGICSEEKVKSKLEGKDKFWESVPFIGKKNQMGCCMGHVEKACGQTFEEMDQSNSEVPNSEKWAYCMRSYAFTKNTTECESDSCKNWVADCSNVGLTSIRKEIQSRKKKSDE